jgi:hypothetical protein
MSNNENYVVFKLNEEEGSFWDRLSVNLTLEKAQWFRDSCRSTYKGCKFLIVQIIEDDLN